MSLFHKPKDNEYIEFDPKLEEQLEQMLPLKKSLPIPPQVFNPLPNLDPAYVKLSGHSLPFPSSPPLNIPYSLLFSNSTEEEPKIDPLDFTEEDPVSTPLLESSQESLPPIFQPELPKIVLPSSSTRSDPPIAEPVFQSILQDPHKLNSSSFSKSIVGSALSLALLLTPAQCKNNPLLETSSTKPLATSVIQLSSVLENPIEVLVPPTEISQQKIFSLVGDSLVIHPEDTFGASSYAQVLASYSLEELLQLDHSSQLSLVSRARVTQASYPYVMELTKSLIDYNFSSFKNLDLSAEGLRDPKKNSFFQAPLTLPLDYLTIFDYAENSPQTIEDDLLTINCLVQGAGLSKYALATSENDWTPKSLVELSELSLLDQIALVTRNAPEKDIFLLDFLANAINSNPRAFYAVDTSYSGLTNSQKNILAFGAEVEISPNYPIDQRLESEQSFRDSLSPLEKLATDYLEVSRFSQEIPYFEEENKRMLRDISLQMATLYNKPQRTNVSDLSSFNHADRLEIARSLYQNANDRHDTKTYMTFDDILDLVNLGSEQKITSKEIYESTNFRRSNSISQRVADRRAQILEDYMRLGINGKKSDFVRAAAEQYGVSESTIYRDLKLLNETAIEPQYLL